MQEYSCVGELFYHTLWLQRSVSLHQFSESQSAESGSQSAVPR